MNLLVRPLGSADYALLLEWLQRPHVKRWWDDGDDTLEKVAASYGDDDGIERFMIVSGDHDQPLGYIQVYWNEPAEAGIDLFLGAADRLGQGIGSQAIILMRDRLVARGARRILIDPHPQNERAIRCYQRAGFRFFAEAIDEEGHPQYLMEYVPGG